MSDEYTVHQRNGLKVQLFEGASRFALGLTADLKNMGRTSCTRHQLSPHDLVRMSLETLKVASYHMSEKEIRKLVKDWMTDEGDMYYKESILKNIGKARKD